MASLFVISGAKKGSYYPLGHRTNVVGRNEALPIQILDDLVSRKHLQIRYDKQQDKHYAVDMKSRHGVSINDRKIAEETTLVDGDEILIGQTTLLYQSQLIRALFIHGNKHKSESSSCRFDIHIQASLTAASK